MLIKRENKVGANDLNTVFRPCKIDELVGQTTNKNIIKNYLDNGTAPHTLLFTGPPGCGKTTAARILALGLNCDRYDHPTSDPCLECNSCKSILNYSSMDVTEVNVGQSGGKDHVEALVKDLSTAPFSSRFKILIFDEAHQFSDAAKNLLLKQIEDGYKHVYFIFCTNQPEKLKGKKGDEDPFLQRCPTLHFGRLPANLIVETLKNVAEYEGMHYNMEVLEFIAGEAKGAPRDALINLKLVDDENSWTLESAKNIVGDYADENDPQIIELCHALLKCRWQDSAKIYDHIKTSKPAETIRIAVAGFFVGCMKRAKTFGEGRVYSSVLDVVSIPIYETGLLADHKMYNYMFKVIDRMKAVNKSER